MLQRPARTFRPGARMRPARGSRFSRPAPELLESRLLLYSTLGAQWTYGSRITYSFMPDGTSLSTTAAVPTTINPTDDSTTVPAPLPNVDVVFQAVDRMLGGWKGLHKRPATAAPKKHLF
jgi:hypothetical protein